MDVIYGLIPSMIFIGLVLIVILFWAIKTGQFDDFEGEAHRILMDEDLTPVKKDNAEEENPPVEKDTSKKNSNNNLQGKTDQ
jgi:cbb3-type cytochrome oxidase maturation protein